MTTDAPEVPGITSLNPYERETVVNASDGDDLVKVWTAQRTYITKLRKNPSFTEVASGHYGTTAWAEFTIPSSDWNPASGAKRRVRPLTEAEKILAAARLQGVREAREDVKV